MLFRLKEVAKSFTPSSLHLILPVMSSPAPPIGSPPALDIDAALDPTTDLGVDVDLDMALDGAADPKPEDPLDAPIPEPREPTKKDISLRDFVSKMDDYAPIVPLPLPLAYPFTPPRLYPPPPNPSQHAPLTY